MVTTCCGHGSCLGWALVSTGRTISAQTGVDSAFVGAPFLAHQQHQQQQQQKLDHYVCGLESYFQFFLQSVDFSISLSELLLKMGTPSIHLCLQQQCIVHSSADVINCINAL